MKANAIETIMGALVLIVAIGFAVTAYESSSIRPQNGYSLSARFESVDGVGLGSDVRIGGIKIGSVTSQNLDAQTYEAVLGINIQSGIDIPDDSSAAIVSDGLLGSKYVGITPGGSEDMLKDGGKLTLTQSSVNLEQLIGKVMFSGGADQKE